MSSDRPPPPPPSPPNWGPPEGSGPPLPEPPDPWAGAEPEPLLPWETPTEPVPRNPYLTPEDTFPASSPYAPPMDPAAIAAEHQAAAEGEAAAAAAPARTGGAHRIQRSPVRYVLPALLGAVVVVAIGIGLVGWIGNPDSTATGTTPSQVHVTSNPPASTASTPSSVATTPSPTVTASSSAPAPSPSASHHVTAPPPPPVVHAPVVVLNETTQRGMAARVAAHLRGLGWTVTGVGNWRGNVATSTVYYPAGDLAAARRLAYDLGITRLRPRVAGMLPGKLTVVLTSDPLS